MSAFLSDKQVADRYSVTRTSIWRWLKKDPTFPKPISLSAGCSRWRLEELEAWEQKRIKASSEGSTE